MKFLVEAFQAKQPSTTSFAKSLKENTSFSAAVKRLAVKTNGSLFQLEDGENGQGYAVELLTGQNMKILIEKADYAEILKELEISKATPPKPPQGPTA